MPRGSCRPAASGPTSYSSASRPRSLASSLSRSNRTRASSTRPFRASALTSQNEHARNCPSSPGSPSSVSAVEYRETKPSRPSLRDTATIVRVTRSSVPGKNPIRGMFSTLASSCFAP